MVDEFDMSFQGPFFAELVSADLALESLESSVYSVDVGPEVLTQTKILPTLSALVGLQFLVNCPDVSPQVSSISEIFLTLLALVGLEFFVNHLDVFVKIMFVTECLATSCASAVVDISVDCALVSHKA